MANLPVDAALGATRKTGSTGFGRIPMSRALMIASAFVGLSGWTTAGVLYFVQLPAAAQAQKVGYALDLVDRFGDSPAQQAYMRLGEAMKPWWSEIDDLQRHIAAATDDDQRAMLIARRDDLLMRFISTNKLAADIDVLVESYDQFQRCLVIAACDEDALRKSIAVDVKRIYRTFRPYILFVRASDRAGASAFGRNLEELFFRFVG